MRLLLLSCAFLAIAACQKPAQEKTNEAAATAEVGPHKGVDRSHKGEAAPASTFNAPDGKPITLAKFKGVPVLVNLWATWCAPCVKELPTIDKVAAAHRGDGELGVIAVNQENAPPASVKAFLEKTAKVKDLGAYQDPQMALLGKLGPDAVLPTTFLYDADGKEVWRYVGDLDWTSPEAAKLLAEAKAGGTG